LNLGAEWLQFFYSVLSGRELNAKYRCLNQDKKCRLIFHLLYSFIPPN
jgi:hypothetical protein